MRKIILFLAFLGLGNFLSAQTFTVNQSTGNSFMGGAGTPNGATSGSFTRALIEANNGNITQIVFTVSTVDLGGAQQILTGAGGVTITAKTVDCKPGVTITNGPGGGPGLRIRSGNNVIEGINFRTPIYLETTNSTGNIIRTNYFNTSLAGTASSPGTYTNYCIYLDNASGNTIGGPNACDLNLINYANHKIHLNNNSSNNVIEGNIIGGLAIDGVTQLAEKISMGTNTFPESHGIFIEGGGTGTIIRRNIISNNRGGHGIRINQHNTSTIVGNYIGVDSSGTIGRGNWGGGIYIGGNVSSSLANKGNNYTTGHVIGGVTAADRNIISDNGNGPGRTNSNGWETVAGHGIELKFAGNTTIRGNYVGTDATGLLPLGNHMNGIYLQNSSNNTIGGTTTGAKNIVGANGFAFAAVQDPAGSFTFKRHGIQIDGNHYSSTNDPSEDNVIKGNWIGVGADGVTALGNGEDGISIYRFSNDNIIGGPTDAEKNISVNNHEGIFIQLNSQRNVVQGNWVGLLPDGVTAVGNLDVGIKVQGQSNQNIIGGSVAGQGNVIVGHPSHGVLSTSDPNGPDGGQGPAEQNIFFGNIIGDTTLANSNPSFANAGDGIHIQEQSQGNIIGGPKAGQGNIIGNNGGNAVFLLEATSFENRIIGNTMICNGGRGIELNGVANEKATLGPIQINISDTDPSVLKGFAAGYPRIVANGGPSVVHFYRFRTICGQSQCDPDVEGYELLDSVQVTSGTLPGGAGTGGVWQWTLPPGVSKNEVTATVTDAAGNTSEFASCVTVCTDPGTVTFTSNATQACQGSSVTLTATASGTPVPTGGFTYNFYRVASPDVLVQSSTSNTYPATVSGTYYVVVSDASDPSSCSEQSANNITITINNLPNTSVITAGQTSICEGTSGVSFSVTNTPGSTYAWTVPSGAIISTGQGTNSITVDFPVGASSGNVRVVETTANGCTSSSTGDRTIAVTINKAPNTSTITASQTAICEGTTGVTFSVTNTTGSTYAWTVPTGAIITAGQGTNSITVSFPVGASSGNVQVVETTTNGCTSNATGRRTIAVTINKAPNTSTITASQTAICEGTTGVTFSVTNTTGSTYAWTVPTGAIITAGQGTNSITVSFPVGASSGNVRVIETTTSGCTSSSTGDRTIAVTINKAPNTSTITASQTAICEGTTGVTFSVTNTTGSTYAWTVPTGAIITAGQGTNSITVSFPVGASSGNVRVIETTTSGCTSSSTGDRTIAVTINKAPNTSTITASQTAICEGTTGVTFSVTNTTGSTYAWTVPTGAIITAGQGTNSITVSFPVGASSGNVRVIETTTSGCTSSSTGDRTVAVTVNTLPGTITINGDFAPACNALGEVYTVSGATAGSSFAWTVPAGATITSGGVGPNNTAINVDFGSQSGNITVLETAANGCQGTQATQLISLAGCGLQASFEADVLEVCVGETVTFTDLSSFSAAIDSWDWDFGTDATPADANTQGPHAVTYSSSGLKTVILTVTEGAASSTETKVAYIQVNELPNTSVITAGQTSICEETTGVTFSVTNTPGSTYNWSVPSGASITSGQGTNSITVDFPVGAQSGNVRVVETTSSGCTSVATGEQTIAVTINSAPNTSVITASQTDICEETTGVTFSVTNTPGSTYAWTVPTGAVITSGQGTNSITVDFPVGAQSGDVIVTETTSSSCTSTNTGVSQIAVIVNSAPNTSAITASQTDICEETTGVSFSVTNTPGSTYTWTVPSGAVISTGQGTNSITVDFPVGAQSGDVIVTETTSSSCTSTNTGVSQIAVIVNSAPNTSVITASETDICEETTGVTFSVTNTPGSTYAWTVPAGAIITSGQGTNSIIVDFPVGAQSGDVIVTETTSSSCTSTNTGVSQIAVIVNSAPNTSVISAGDTQVCEGTTGIIFSVTNTIGSTYNWTVPSGAVIASGQGTNTITVNFPVGTVDGDVTVTETTVNGCSSTATGFRSVAMIIDDLPDPLTITGDIVPPCSAPGEVYNVTGGSAGSSFAWTVPTGAVIASGATGPDNTSITVNFSTISGSITVQETTTQGCVGSIASTSISLQSCGLEAGVDDAEVCLNGSLLIMSQSQGTTASTNYYWDFGGGPAGAGASPQSAEGIGPHLVTFNQTGIVTVTLTIEENGVFSSDEAQITVLSLPAPQIEGSGVVCKSSDSTYEVKSSTGSGFSEFNWFVKGNGRFVNNTMTAQGTEVDVFFRKGDTTKLVVSETDPSTGCIGTSDTLFIVTDTLESRPGANITINDIQQVSLDGRASEIGIGMVFPYERFSPIEWSSLQDVKFTDVTNELQTTAIPYESPTYFRLEVTNPVTGCKDIDSVTIFINFEVIPPTGFSPNNDGENDTWEIWNIDKFPNNKVEIYNRWGSLVWEKSNYTNEDGWRGQNKNGSDLPIGTYFFVVTINGDPTQDEPYSGPVTIIK